MRNWEFEEILDGVWRVKAPSFIDYRGGYYEFFNEQQLAVLFRTINKPMPKFVEFNHSDSHPNVIRGFHGDRDTWKYVGCGKGCLIVTVMNEQQAWVQVTLTREMNHYLLIPPLHGLAHLAWQTPSTLIYALSTYYDRDMQFTWPWNKVPWPIDKPILSERDGRGTWATE